MRAAAVLAMILAAGCGRVSFERRDAGAGVDAGVDAGPRPDAGPPLAAISIAELDDVGAELNPTLTSDELEIYFASDRGGDLDIYVARRASRVDAWGAPEPVTELESTAADGAPELSPDGLEMLFTSERAPSRAGDLWHATRASRGDPWSAPAQRTDLSSNLVDCCAVTTPDGLTLFMSRTSSPTVGNWDLLTAVRAVTSDPWGTQSAVPVVNTSRTEAGPFLSADLLTMFFDAARTDSIGAHDFYSATRPAVDQPFAAPVRLERLSTTSDERDLWISPDGARAYFASDRDGEWTIFVADLR